MKTVLSTTNAPGAIGPYSQGMKKSNIVITSGQLGLIPETGILPEGIQAQTKQSLLNCQAVLTAGGATLADVVKTTVYLSDMNDFAAMNEIYKTFFPTDSPARSAVQVARLPKDGLVEIECLAIVD